MWRGEDCDDNWFGRGRSQKLFQHVHLDSCPSTTPRVQGTSLATLPFLTHRDKLPFLAPVLSQVGRTTKVQPTLTNTSHSVSLSASLGSVKHVLYSLEPGMLLESRVQPAAK